MNIVNFKELHERFTDALKYITENEIQLRTSAERWEKIKKNFVSKFEAPLDEAWNALPEEDKKRFASLYLFRKAAQDEKVKEVLDMFGGKVTGVSYEEKENQEKRQT